MTGLCRDCSFWEQESFPIKPAFGRCALSGTSDGEPVEERSLAFARDSEGWAAYLATHETFGCVQFEGIIR
jgi:hypothetical protein